MCLILVKFSFIYFSHWVSAESRDSRPGVIRKKGTNLSGFVHRCCNEWKYYERFIFHNMQWTTISNLTFRYFLEIYNLAHDLFVIFSNNYVQCKQIIIFNLVLKLTDNRIYSDNSAAESICIRTSAIIPYLFSCIIVYHTTRPLNNI